MNLGIIASSSNKILPATQLWVDAVYAAGGILSSNNIFYTNLLVDRLQQNGLWNDLKAYYPFVGATANSVATMNAHKINLRNPGTYDFTYPDSIANGHGINTFVCTNSNHYCNTNLAPSTAFTDINNMSFGSYVYNGPQISNNMIFGARGPGGGSSTKMVGLSSYFSLAPGTPTVYAAIGTYSIPGGYVRGTYSPIVSGAYTGAVYTARNSSTSLKLFDRGNLITTETMANTGTLPTNNVYINGYNNNGSSQKFPSNAITISSAWFANKAFSNAEMTTFYQIENEIITLRIAAN